ncbi:DUF4430 domain-containing protein [Streptococcus pantholopis]|uniref:Cobalamin ECF transporter n=1 Tax=Streptococcus pantholopis TaxID=1811193 RepID=A0A172Q6H3_9STRE|nr:DUF4430 domain-containing protein [Streptococcus pantholopis]AND79007.1 cobalamin ECF transporter [Streptococcus pantholopis]
MKKISRLIVTVLSFIVLTACSTDSAPSSSNSASSDTGTVQLIVQEDSNTIDETVTFEKGDTVMDVLQDNYEVEETDGFITAIDGITQDEEAGKYWMFTINDELAPKAADQIKVKNGDKIEFYQDVYAN